MKATRLICTKIASIGSAVALLVFSMITVAHIRLRREPGANIVVLVVAIVVVATATDLLWKRTPDHGIPSAPTTPGRSTT